MANVNKKGKSSQLCWDCQRALPLRGCPWADNFQPVEGWTATPKVLTGNVHTFAIRECPLFLADKPATEDTEEVPKRYIVQYTKKGRKFVAEYPTIAEVEKVLNVSQRTVYRMLRNPLEKDEFILKEVTKYEKRKNK
jgi:hypothetical protein